MVEPLAVIVVVLLLAGVVGSAVPLLPSGLLSLSGVYVYYIWGSHEMGLLLLAGFTFVGLTAAVLEHFAAAVSARASGASTGTMLYAAVAGLLLFFVTGPIGILLGIFGVVLASEIRDGGSPKQAARRACFTVVGVLGSTVVQILLTLSILVGFLLFLLIGG